MSEAQAQGQATPSEAGTQGARQEQGESQDSTLTREDHIRELKRVGKKEKAEGQQKAINDLLEKTGAESIDDVLSAYSEYQGIQEAVTTEADRERTAREKAEAKAQAAEDRYTGTLKTYALRDALRDAGINPERLKGAMRLADTDALEIDSEGNVSGLEDVIEAVKEEAPEFFGEGLNQRQRVNAPETNGQLRVTHSDPMKGWADDLLNIIERQT